MIKVKESVILILYVYRFVYEKTERKCTTILRMVILIIIIFE